MFSTESGGKMNTVDNRGEKMVRILVYFLSAVSVLWVLSERNYFVFDDTSILARDGLTSYDNLFSFFPTSVYLDRPIRDIILKWMLQVFWEKLYTAPFLFICHPSDKCRPCHEGHGGMLSAEQKQQRTSGFFCKCFCRLVFWSMAEKPYGCPMGLCKQ